MLRRGSWLVFLLLCGACVRAQIVNIEGKRQRFDSTGWYGQADLGGNLNKNNNTVLALNAGLRIDRLAGRHVLLFLGDYRLVQVSGSNAINSGFGHLRYGYDLNEKWRWETFGQLQYNEQLRLNLRRLIGTGLRRRLFENERGAAYLGLLYMYEYDELQQFTIAYRDHRLSSYFSLAVKIGRLISLSNTTYYQPLLFTFDGERLSSVTNLGLRLTDRLSVTTAYNITNDVRLARDLEDVPSTTYNWRNGLRWTFR